MRKLDLGVAAFGNPDLLEKAVASIERHSITDYRLLLVVNPHPDESIRTSVRQVCESVVARNNRAQIVTMETNTGYAGAVNKLIRSASTHYVAYTDADIEIQTPGWDEKLCQILDANPECAQVFPGQGHYGFFNGKYNECLWSAGFCWVLRPSFEVNGHYDTMMDEYLGHHEEVDLSIKLRLNGKTLGCAPDVVVIHHESSTQSPESAKRIHAGVVRWMNRWNKYFCGDILKYPNPNPDSGEGYDPRSLRYTDWHPDALYLERMTLHYFPDWNSNPRTVNVPGVGEMDVIEVLKPKGCYVGRAI